MKLKRSFIIPAVALVICAVLHITFLLTKELADLYNNTVAAFIRMALAYITGIIPISLAELMLYMLPLAVTAAVILAYKSSKKASFRLLYIGRALFTALVIIYALFVLTFASGYSGSGIDERLQLEKEKVSAKELYEALLYVTEKANECAELIEYNSNGSSSMPYDYQTLSEKLSSSYQTVYSTKLQESTFNSRVKTIAISPLMTYTHISGVYSFFTGEANINTNYPDYVCVFSSAHEMAHQRGFSREDEANFMAYLVCTESNDLYIQYSGYLSMFSYLSSALIGADGELYSQALSTLCDEAKGELAAYSRFFEKYRDNAASKVTDAVNDTYLKAQGTEGVKSYGMVVDLAVAYHKIYK